MTTLFGVRHPAVNAAVLVGDRQGTLIDGKNSKIGTKELKRKIQVSDDGFYAIGHAGMNNDATKDFMQEVISGEYELEQIISNGFFEEFQAHNVRQMGIGIPDTRNISYLVLMTRFNNDPKIYLCEPMGRVKEDSWTTAGKGGPRIVEYMEYLQVKQEVASLYPVVESKNPGVNDLVQIGLEALMRAQNLDLSSQGLDMLVCTPEKITDHNLDLNFDFEKKLTEIQKHYSE